MNTPQSTANRLLTAEEAAIRLGITPRHLTALWKTRKIGAVKVGRSVRFDPADLDRWIDDHRVAPVE